MDGLGDRMRARARDLGWSDAEVARRVGVGQTRYANYVTDRHEPDLSTFVRICAVLGASPSELLGRPEGSGEEALRLRARVAATMEALEQQNLAILAAVADGLVATSSRSDCGRSARPAPRRRKGGSPGH